VNDIPALHPGFEGPAGKRAARSASSVAACINPIARSTHNPFCGIGRFNVYEYASNRSINA